MSSEDFRLGYHQCRDLLAKRLAEPAPGRIQLLAGPRQVGKTTLLLEIAERPTCKIMGSGCCGSPTRRS